MKISLKWINDFVDISDYIKTPQVIADLLTKAGLEVEEVQDLAAQFKNVVVGQVKVKDKHPNADKLSLCQVDIGNGKIEQIVCGAQNHKAGDKVVVALPGAVLPGNFAIKKSKIRDVESNGMLCSLKELGMTGNSDGILIIPVEAKNGQNFAEHSGFDDITFELKVTPNRADCLSHFGLARELGCLLNRPVKPPEVLSKFDSKSTQSKIKLEVQDTENCLRYTGRFIENVKIGESPEWLKKRLESVGLNSINNVVDITNYVMIEMGQPLHAFDYDLIKNQKIIVRRAQKNEKFKTLKEQVIEFAGDELLICDSEKTLAMAGVIGGIQSGVSDKTKNIFLESACFSQRAVRKASRHHGIETDSAYRFSRGVDQSEAMTMSNRAALLLQQIAGGTVYDLAYDVYPKPAVKAAVPLALKTISERLGYEADEKLLLNFMKGLQVKVEAKSKGEYLMTPPLFRFDLEQDMDLVEEYARLHGYEHIQETIPALGKEPLRHDPSYLIHLGLAESLRAEGFSQAFNYAFTSETFEKKFVTDQQKFKNNGLTVTEKAIAIKNPLSEELNVMRRSLIPGLWKNTLENIRSGNNFGSLFEIGSVFLKSGESYVENQRLALISWGDQLGLYSNKAALIYQVKARLEKLFQSLNINSYSFEQMDVTALDFLHSGQHAKIIIEGQTLGFLGTAHPGWLAEEKIREPAVLAELDLQQLMKGQPRLVKFKTLSKFQPVERDFSFVMKSAETIGKLIKEVKKNCGATLKDLIVFDIYEGEKLAAGQKSVSLKAIFQSNENSLTEAEIQALSQKLIEAAQKSVNANLR